VVAGVARKQALLSKPEEKVVLGRKSKRIPRIFIIDDSPVTVTVGDKSYTCKSIVNTAQGLLCVQYDGSAVLLPQPQQQQVFTTPRAQPV
jgi:hypothetical protein